MRCKSCNIIMAKHPGWVEVELPDGSIHKEEDDMCSSCRNLSNEYYCASTREYVQGGVTEFLSDIYHDGMTPMKSSEY